MSAGIVERVARAIVCEGHDVSDVEWMMMRRHPEADFAFEKARVAISAVAEFIEGMGTVSDEEDASVEWIVGLLRMAK